MKYLTTKDILPDGTLEEIECQVECRFIYVSYGQKNNTQSYGGGTVVIIRSEGKPCFLPVYDGSELIGTIYIYNNTTTNKLNVRLYGATKTFLVKIYAIY